MFSSPKRPHPPAVPPPQPIPIVGEKVEDVEKKYIFSKTGFKKSVLTGALTPSTGKKALLG
jgi:hypothetical protein